MTPIDYYHDQCQKALIVEDKEQLTALNYLQQIYNHLIIENQKRQSLWGFIRYPQLIKGLYLWGGVGVGKTLLMDCFFECLPFPNKLRMHFHQFMQMVHQKLTAHQGEEDPLQAIASEIAKQTIVVCFDEFFVSDITDAMILGRLFKALFAQGVCLVTTSNVAPDDLYKNGLQRLNFLPAIRMIKEETEVVHIPSTTDYRLRHIKEAGVFYSPLNEAAKKNMEKSFATLTDGLVIHTDPILINDRVIKIVKEADGVVWFDFKDICTVPRSQQDYLSIAKKYHTVFINDIPIIEDSNKDTLCLFISLVDVFYDARVRLVISAAEPVQQLYDRGFMVAEYTRTHSRLFEMQSTDYFAGESRINHAASE